MAVRLVEAPESVACLGEGGEGARLEAARAGGVAEGCRSGLVFVGGLEVTQCGVGFSQVVQVDGFPIADLTGQCQGLAGVLDRLSWLADLGVEGPEVGQTGRLPGGPPGPSGEGGGVDVVVDGHRVTALAPVQVSQAEVGGGLTVRVAIGLAGGQRRVRCG